MNVHARAGYFSPDVLKQQGSPYERLLGAQQFEMNTQCSFDAATSTDSPPPLGLKAETYPALGITLNNKTTNFGPEGGFCGMPTQFLHTVRLGGFHRIPRFMSITNSLGHNWPNNQYTPTQCTIQTYMFIPWELLTLQKKPRPTSPALDRFLSIAWDGIGTVNSLWDGCDIGCQNPIAVVEQSQRPPFLRSCKTSIIILRPAPLRIQRSDPTAIDRLNCQGNRRPYCRQASYLLSY